MIAGKLAGLLHRLQCFATTRVQSRFFDMVQGRGGGADRRAERKETGRTEQAGGTNEDTSPETRQDRLIIIRVGYGADGRMGRRKTSAARH